MIFLPKSDGRVLERYSLRWNNRLQIVMAELDPAISKDPRVKPGDDEKQRVLASDDVGPVTRLGQGSSTNGQ
jgi:hypothetical protein